MRRPDTVRAIESPADRARAAMRETAASQRLAVEYRAITTGAVQELRETMSLAEIAVLLGVTRSRVQQLARPGHDDDSIKSNQ